MKRILTSLVGVALLVSAFSGCAIMGLFLPVTQEEAEEAFGLSFGVYISAALVLAFGGEYDGVTIDDETGQMLLTNVDISDPDGAHSYTTMSGTFTPSEDETEVDANLTFDDGPVVMMRYTLTEEILNSSLTSSPATIEVVANYQTFVVTLN